MMMLGVHVGAREDDADPIAEARESGADGVQIFLADPQGWKTPKPHPLADAAARVRPGRLRARARTCSTWRPRTTGSASPAASCWVRTPRPRRPRREGDDRARRSRHRRRRPVGGFDNWRKVFARQAEDGGFPLPILIENTAGGDKAMARHLEAIARLWDAVGEFGAGLRPGHLPRPRLGHRPGDRGRRHQGHHRPDRPGALQQLARRGRLRPGPARAARRRRDRPTQALIDIVEGRGCTGDPGDPRWSRRSEPRRSSCCAPASASSGPRVGLPRRGVVPAPRDAVPGPLSAAEHGQSSISNVLRTRWLPTMTPSGSNADLMRDQPAPGHRVVAGARIDRCARRSSGTADRTRTAPARDANASASRCAAAPISGVAAIPQPSARNAPVHHRHRAGARVRTAQRTAQLPESR